MDDLGPPRDDLVVGDFSVTADEVTCQQFVELITDYLEGAMTTRTLSHVEEHLVMCDWCVTYLEQMDATIASLAALSDAGSAELPDVRLVRPEAGYLAWLDCRALGLGDDPSEVFLERGRVALSGGLPFGAEGKGFARLNIGTSAALLAEAVTRMRSALDG